MGDRAVLIVKAWNKLTWVFIHRHLGVILRYLFQGVRDLSIYVLNHREVNKILLQLKHDFHQSTFFKILS